MLLRMRYPYIKGNRLCDGKIHYIIPQGVSQIDNYDLYYFKYIDQTMNRDCFTILGKDEDIIRKFPLEDYKSFVDMVSRGEIRLTDIDQSISSFFKNYLKTGSYITTNAPIKDFPHLLCAVRAVIELFIDENNRVYVYNYREKEYIEIGKEELFRIMQYYDVVWRVKVSVVDINNPVNASVEKMQVALDKMVGTEIRRGKLAKLHPYASEDGMTVDNVICYNNYKKERIYHYSISYQYTDVNGFKRHSLSI